MAGTLHTPLSDELGVEYPIFLAGMSSGGEGQAKAPTPVKLVAAITNLGGVGVLGDNFNSLDEIDQGIKAVKALVGDKPFGVDFLLPATLAEVGARTNREIYVEIEREYPQHVAFVDQMLRDFNLPDVEVPEKKPLSIGQIQEKLEVVFDNNVPIFAAALGDPAIMTERAHAQGMKVIGMAGAVRHAARHVAADVDIITAQGTEAGGHTGNIATFVLVPQIVDAVAPRPVLAAGGIGSGRHVAAALALGAQGVWVGTAFLVAEEGNSPDSQKDQIVDARSEQFTLSKYGSGKQQRAYAGPLREAWASSGLPVLPMPLQGILRERLSEAIRVSSRSDLDEIPSGQVGGMISERRPAADIFGDLVAGAEETIGELRHSIS
jgi:NAD(P)H-dependent flavin oxidoreductase YrpB (nitropropane dioxygenase family)